MAALFPMRFLVILFGAFLLMAQPASVAAGLFGDSEVEAAMEGAEKDVRSLLQILERPELPFHHTRSRKLLAFEAMAKEDPGSLEPEDIDGASGAYFEFHLPRSLQDVASYLYNANVPPHAVYPGAVRMGGWMDHKVAAAALNPLQGTLPDMENPVVCRGTEYEGTTPDKSSGTYYRYDVNRLVVGFQDQHGPVIISVSRQMGPSTVGEKGVAFGPPGDWYYFYSGIKGNLLAGVGWAEPQMEESISVFVLRQTGPKRTKLGVFKWVRAGWKGMNMVKHKHILEGLRDFGDNLQEVLASPTLPPASTIAERADEVAAMSEEKMRQELAPLQDLLQASAGKNETLQREEFVPLVQGDYLASLNREELAAELLKDYIRRALNKEAITAAPQP